MLKKFSPTFPFLISTVNSHIWDAVFSSPINHGFCYPGDRRHNNLGSRVATLFAACRPSTIVRAVTRVIVYSVDGVAFTRSWPHVFKERFKAVAPTFAHCNAYCPVIGKPRLARFFASANNTLPNNMLRSAAFAMGSPKGANSVALCAPARFGVAKFEFRSSNDNSVAAITNCVPKSPFVSNAMKISYSEPVLFDTGKIKAFCHTPYLHPTSGTVKELRVC